MSVNSFENYIVAKLPTELAVLLLGYNQMEIFSTGKNPTDSIIITTS